MALISQSIGKDLLDMYDGYDVTKVGLGMQDPTIYATPKYQKKKIQNMIIGGISDIVYSGAFVDLRPTCLALGFEPQYNTVIGINLNYGTPMIRRKIMKFILESNAARIKSKSPLIIKYDSLKRLVPQVQGMIRRYKIIGIRVEKTYQINEWPEILKKQSRYEKIYMTGTK